MIDPITLIAIMGIQAALVLCLPLFMRRPIEPMGYTNKPNTSGYNQLDSDKTNVVVAKRDSVETRFCICCEITATIVAKALIAKGYTAIIHLDAPVPERDKDEFQRVGRIIEEMAELLSGPTDLIGWL